MEISVACLARGSLFKTHHLDQFHVIWGMSPLPKVPILSLVNIAIIQVCQRKIFK